MIEPNSPASAEATIKQKCQCVECKTCDGVGKLPVLTGTCPCSACDGCGVLVCGFCLDQADAAQADQDNQARSERDKFEHGRRCR